MARKYNVTSSITDLVTVYKAYDEESDTVKTVKTHEAPKLDTTKDKDDILKDLRKYNINAVKFISQDGKEKKYGMTDETFMSLAFPVSKSNRRGFITRDKKNICVDLQMFDMETREMSECKEVLIPADIAKKSKQKIESYIRETKETATMKVLTVSDMYDKTDENVVYAVTKDVFIANAVELDDKGNEVNHEQ